MKNIKYLSFIGLMVLTVLFACEPFEDTNPELGIVEPPAESEMDFSITPANDDYRYNVELTSPQVSGIHKVSFTLGNGNTIDGKSGIAYYPLPGEYTITMTIKTNAGSSSVSKTHTTTATDYSLFDDPMIIALSGGTEALEGKTWVIDSLENAHLGVGPADSYSPDWWSAVALEKNEHPIYDDEFTFKLVGFEYNIDTHGSTHVNADNGAADRGIEQGFYTSVIWEDQYDKDVTTDDDARGDLTWSLVEEDGKNFIVLSSYAGVIGYDGGNERKYEILSLDENFMHLRSVGGAARYHKLIRKGYERPQVELEASVNATGETNTYEASVNVTNVPAGESVDSIKVDFGEGTVVETSDVSEVITNTFMRKGSYTVTLTVVSSLGDIVNTFNVEVENNHPDYEPFLLDAMVTYNDFSEVSMAPMQIDLAGGAGSIEIVDNPERIYPNKTARVLKFVKENTEWANAYMELPAGYRFDIRQRHTFKVMVYGSAGDKVLLKLENTDRGGNAYQTGTADVIYTIQQDNTWEVAEFDFAGVAAGWDGSGDIFTSDVTTDDNFSHDFYNVVRIMINPGDNTNVFQVYLDELAGPHVEGLKSATR